MDYDRALAIYRAALVEYEATLAAEAMQLLNGEEVTPEQASHEEVSRQNLENARVLFLSLVRIDR
jgi:hypothetical protein